jgi:hypothetical protein
MFMTKSILTVAIAAALAQIGNAAFFADEVISYSAGAYPGTSNNASVVLGSPGPIVDPSGFASVFSPFSGHYEPTQVAVVGFGGEITLRLSHYVTIDRTPGVKEIGIWENVSLIDSDYPNGNAGPTATALGSDSAVVKVSQDGINWFTLNGGSPIRFELPGNYFTNAGPFDSAAPANPQFADFGKPFTGGLTDFNGKIYSQILATLNGSAGGTWLNLDDAPFEKVGFVRFDGVAAGQTFELNAVAINTALAGSTVPEPSAAVTLLAGAAFLAILKRRQL